MITKPCSTLRSALRLALAATCAGALLGCFDDAPPPLRSPAPGGHPWTQLDSPHFTLSTDVPPDVARLTLVDFEVDYGLLASVLPHPESAAAPKIAIVLFERSSDFSTVTRKSDITGAFFAPHLEGDLEDAPTLVLRHGAAFSAEGRTTFLHELTHRFFRARGARLPLWLTEGLADYYSTIRDAGTQIRVGELPAGRRFGDSPNVQAFWGTYTTVTYTGLIPLRAAPSISTLLATGPERFYGLEHPELTDDDRGTQLALYAGAHRLVHFLRNGGGGGSPARFDAFVAAIEGGTSSREAFAATFGDPTSPILGAAYRRYVATEDLPTVTMPFTGARGLPATSARIMTSGEVLDLWARLRPWEKATRDAVRFDLDRAVAADPGATETLYRRALFALREKRFDDARRDLDAALVARPGDPRYLFARAVTGRRSGLASGSEDPALRGIYAQLAQAAASASQLNEVAWALAMLGRPADGLPFIDRALATDPACGHCEDTRAVLLFGLGRAQEALAAIERAVALLPEGRPSRLYLLRRTVLLVATSQLREHRAPPADVLSSDLLAAIAHLYDNPVRACRGAGGARAPLAVRAVIGPEGSVRSAAPALATTDKAAVCAVQVARSMIFPPFAGAAREVVLSL